MFPFIYLLGTLGLLSLKVFAATDPVPYFKCDFQDDEVGNNRSFFPGATWPGAIVKYEYDVSLTTADRAEVQKAFVDIQGKTCIRFHARSPGEAAYVNIEYDETVCGNAVLCRTGGKQHAKFGGICRNKNTMVHELGHALCLGHEFARRDRDDYLTFNQCSPNEIPGKNNYETRGHLFDYVSRMNYQCGWCPGGWPTMAGVSASTCGIAEGLSVMDADKLNDLYDCKGCFSHRWRPIDNLSSDDRRNLKRFGSTETGSPLYLCRAYVGGTMSSGKYWAQSGICYLSYNGREYQFTSRAQVFTSPGSQRKMDADSGSMPTPTYHITSNFSRNGGFDSDVLSTAIPVGRKPNNVACFAAVADIQQDGHGKETSIGVVCEDNMSRAYFPYWGKEVVLSKYALVACG